MVLATGPQRHFWGDSYTPQRTMCLGPRSPLSNLPVTKRFCEVLRVPFLTMERENALRLRALLTLFCVGSVLTLATGFLPLVDMISPGGEWQYYGLPFPWKGYARGCPPPCLQTGTNYAWPFFALDVVSYAIVSYGLVYILSQRPDRQLVLKRHLESAKSLALLATTIAGLFMANVAYDLVLGMGSYSFPWAVKHTTFAP